MYEKFINELLKWNKVHKLTNYKTKEDIKKQIEDSLYPLNEIKNTKTAIDIGTGAGFPGLILAMALPDTKVVLVEPLAKRASFLQFIKATLHLDNVTVVKKRVEQMQPKIFDLITSRAVTDTEMLLNLSKNFRDENSLLLFYKGEKVFDEVKGYSNYEIIKKENRHYLLMKGN